MSAIVNPSQALAEHIIGRPLSEYVREKRTGRPRWSWQEIADQLAADTRGQVVLSRETLRTWFGTDGEAVPA